MSRPPRLAQRHHARPLPQGTGGGRLGGAAALPAEVFSGGYGGGTVRWQFESRMSPDYDFSKNVRME